MKAVIFSSIVLVIVVAIGVLDGEGDCLDRLYVGVLPRGTFNGSGGLFYHAD